MSYVVLDTETTSKYPAEAECLQVAIIDHTGVVLLNTLVKPERAKKWDNQDIHGISPTDVKGAPTLASLTPTIAALLSHRTVVIYNASYDTQVLHAAFAQAENVNVCCAMLAYSSHEEVREWNYRYDDWRYQSLRDAASHVGHVWQGEAHNALADCYAARDVWAWLTDPAERERLDEAKAARREAQELAWHIRDVFGPLEKAEAERLRQAGWAWERAHYPAMGVCERRGLLPDCLCAEKSADAFALHLEGTTARAWNRWGEKLLKLPRYERVGEGIPKGLTAGDGLHLLPAAQRLKPVGLLYYGSLNSPPHEWLDAKPLYKLRSLRKGVHCVPILPGYEPWPEGHYTKTQLQRDLKLKTAQIEQLRPAYLRHVVRGSSYENSYLLYPYTKPADEKSS